MTLYDLILGYGGARTTLEEDAAEYYWGLTELTNYFNKAEQEACLRSLILKYRHTSDIIGAANSGLTAKVADSICKVSVLSGISEYALNGKVLEVLRARISTEEEPLYIKTRKQMDQIDSAWMDPAASTGTPLYLISEVDHEIILVPVPDTTYNLYLIVAILPRYDMAVPEYGTDISFDATTKQIRRTAGAFVVNGYVAGAKVKVTGSASNNSTFTISAVTSATVLTVTETVVNEAAGASVIVSSSPEIPEQYHRDLIDYALYLAYKKRGRKTDDLKKAALHLDLFTQVFGPRKKASMEEIRVATPLEGGMLAKKYRI
jgi:hypothetical protein